MTRKAVQQFCRPSAEDYAHSLERDLQQIERLRLGQADPEALPFLAVQASAFWPIALRRALWAEYELERLRRHLARLEGRAVNVVSLDEARRAREQASRCLPEPASATRG